MSDNTDNNKQPQIIMGGVSGNKELKIRRVHKKKTDSSADAAVAEKKTTAEKAAAPATKPAPAEKAPAKTVKKAETEAPKKENKAAETKKEEKKAAAPVEQTPKTEVKEEKPVEKKAAPKTEVKENSAAEKKPAVKSEKTDAPKPEPAPEKKEKEVKKPESENKAPAKNETPVIDKRKISSAVVAMPETIRSSTVISDNRNNRYGNRNGAGAASGRGSYQNRGGNGANGGRGGGYQNRGGNGGGAFAKDKDDEPNTKQQPRKASKPKTDTPVDEVRKSRANFVERNAIEKRQYDSRDNAKGGNGNDRRMKNKNSQFSGRISEDGDYDDYSYGRKKKKKNSFSAAPVVEQTITDIQLPPFITVKEFAEGIGKKSADVIKELMKLGMLATINQELDFDTACLLADAFGINATPITEVTEEDILFEEETETGDLKQRPPVVVVMGHVDHGKTSLLDRIRATSVVSGEAGGITQHIGAYTVRLKGRQITFLDTPGHEAFTTMRARGAQVTDIAILVVAADDGVMPQTIEAINHAKAANTEIIVAINKIDKPGANIDKVKQELSNYELIPEEWGGSTIMVPVSAKQGQGIDDLLEMVLLTADVLELKADPTAQAKGTVIEAKLDKNRGPVATVLVQQGTLKHGSSVVCGAMLGNIRAMYDDKGSEIKKAGPSIPVEILGLPEVPEAGETLYDVTGKDDKVVRQLVEKRKIKQREDHMHKSSRMSLETLAANIAAGDVKDLNLIVKADVQGSVEAVIQSLEKLSNDEVRVKVIHGAVGAINESDVTLADVSDAIIIGFNVRPNAIITEMAKEVNVDIRLYSVIYNAIEDVENAMKGMLAPTLEEVVLGHVEIRELFKVSGVGTIGGAYVLDGKITRNSDVRVVRDDVVVYTGHLGSLQRMKDAVKEVNTGYECGLSIENYNDIKIGDIIEAYEIREVART